MLKAVVVVAGCVVVVARIDEVLVDRTLVVVVGCILEVIGITEVVVG